MAFRRKYRKRKRFSRGKRKGKVHYKISKKKFAPRWADCALTKFKSVCTNVLNTLNSQASFNCGNTDSTISLVNDAAASGDVIRLSLVPKLDLTLPNARYGHVISMGATASSPSPLTCTLPTLDNLDTRYTGYRVMCVKYNVSIRPRDSAAVISGSPPLLLWYFPYQLNATNEGNYWAENAATLPVLLKPENVGNLKYGGSRKIAGFGGKAYTTAKFVWYPWKIYGKTRQQWLSDSRAFNVIGSEPQMKPYVLFGVADYSSENIRTWQVDIRATYYIRWEGQKFLNS